MEESELYTAFSDQERKELLFRIFSHMVFGGASNQYEDHVEEYFKATKAIYKDLLSVRNPRCARHLWNPLVASSGSLLHVRQSTPHVTVVLRGRQVFNDCVWGGVKLVGQGSIGPLRPLPYSVYRTVYRGKRAGRGVFVAVILIFLNMMFSCKQHIH